MSHSSSHQQQIQLVAHAWQRFWIWIESISGDTGLSEQLRDVDLQFRVEKEGIEYVVSTFFIGYVLVMILDDGLANRYTLR